MARIKTYNNDPIIQSGDKVIGTDATDNSTKNFGIDQLLAYFRDNITGGDQADNITGFTATTSGNTVTLRLNFTTGIPLVASFILAEGTGSIHSGTQDPITGQIQGRVGDFYLQVVPVSADGSTPPVSNLYGPLASATGTTSFANWGTPTSLLGQQGIQGIAGTQGNSITIENIDLGSAGQESSFDLQIVDASGADVGSPQTITLQPGSDGATITSIGSTNSGVGTDSIVTVTTDADTNNIFTFTIPAGATGVQGIQGFQGDGVEVTNTSMGANQGDNSTVTFTNTDVDPATGATTQTTETLTVRAGVQGHQGRFDLEVYQVLASTLPRPATPEGGSYDTVLGTFNSTGLTAGWVTVIPSVDETTQRLWESRLNLNPISYVSGTALGASWSTPFLAGSTGPTGVAAGFGTPTATTLAPVDATTLATATVTSSGPDTAKVFALGVPAGLKGDKGDSGTNGSAITVTQARNTDDDANIVTFTSSDTTVTPVVVTIPDGEDVTTNMIQATAITEYSAADTYNTNHAVYDSTGIYASIIDGNINNPLTDVGSWTKITAFITDARISKLDGIETAATADQTDAEIRVAVGAADDSNVFTDAEKTKLSNVEALATADQTGAEIKTAYEGEANTNAYTDAEKAKLTGIETGATEDQTAAEIKTAYESNSDTNAFTDAEKTKLGDTTLITLLSEQTISPVYAFTQSFTSITGQTSLTVGRIPADLEVNPTTYTLTAVHPSGGTSAPVSISVTGYNSGTLTFASAITNLAIGDNDLTLTKTGTITQLESDAVSTDIEGDLTVNRVLRLLNPSTIDSGLEGSVWSDDGTLVLSGSTAASGGGAAYPAPTIDNESYGNVQPLNFTSGGGVDINAIIPAVTTINTNVDSTGNATYLVNSSNFLRVSMNAANREAFWDLTIGGDYIEDATGVNTDRFSVMEVTVFGITIPINTPIRFNENRVLIQTAAFASITIPADSADLVVTTIGDISFDVEDSQDWDSTDPYAINDVVNFRGGLYKRRNSAIAAGPVEVSTVPGFTAIFNSIDSGLSGPDGVVALFQFGQGNAPTLVDEVEYRFTVGEGGDQYVITADPEDYIESPAGFAAGLTGTGLHQADAINTWVLRLVNPGGTIAPGFTVVSVAGVVSPPDATFVSIATERPGQESLNGSQITSGVGAPNTAPNEDTNWEDVSTPTFGASRWNLIANQVISFSTVLDTTVGIFDRTDTERSDFTGVVESIYEFDRDQIDGLDTATASLRLTFQNPELRTLFPVGSYNVSTGGRFQGRAITRIVPLITTGTDPDDAATQVRFKTVGLITDSSDIAVASDTGGPESTVPGTGGLALNNLLQIAPLTNITSVDTPLELPAGLPVRFQSRVATSGRLLPFMAAVTTENPDIFNEYESRLTYDFTGTIVQTSDIDRLAVTVVGTENQIGSVQGEIHSDLMGYVIHENGDTYFLANPTVIEDAMGDPTDVYNFDVVSVGGGSFAEIFRDVTMAVAWEGEYTIYLATEVVPYLNVTRAQEARWDEAAARNIPEIIRTHSTIGLTDLDDASSADDEFSFVPTTTGDSGISISANNRSFTPNVVLRIADTHSILSMPVSATDIAKLRVGDSYFFSAGGTRLVGHIITDAEANTDNGFGRYQAAATDGVVHLYLDDVSSRVVANIGTLGVNRFSINRHNQNIETEYGWFFQVTTFNGITYTTTDVSAFRFYAIDTTDQIILKDGSVEVAIRHLDGTLIAGVGVQEEGTDLTTLADTLNFVGAGVIATGTGSTKTITINSATTIPEHNTIPVTSSGTSNPNDLIGWELEIGRPGEGLQRDFVAANGTSTSRINLMLIDAHPRLRVTFSDGTVALATIIGSSSSTVTTTQLIGQFDVARESSAINTPETVDIRYFGEDVPSSYIASPLSVNANDEVIYNGEEITTTNMRTSGLLFRGIGNPENWFGGSGASRASQVIAGDQYQNSSTGHTFERSATGLVTATNGWSSASTIIANTSASLNGLTITPDSQSSPTVLTIASPANSDLAINASPSPGSTGSGNERVTIEGVQFNDGAIASVTSINGDPVANADALFRSGGYINAWITGTVTDGTTTFGLGFASIGVETYTDIQGDARTWLFVPTLTITGTGASAAFALGDGIWTRLTTSTSAQTILEHESTFLL